MSCLWRRPRRQPRNLSSGGREAREKAERELEQTRARRPQVQEMADVTRRRRLLNGFTHDIEIAIGRRS